MTDWSDAFGAPVHLHRGDADWVMRPGDQVTFWTGDRLDLLPGCTLLRCGGHFAGATVLHWQDGADGHGILFSGDTLQVLPDRSHVSVMRSYPNFLPVSAAIIGHVADILRPFAFDRIYGAFDGRTIERDGKAAVDRSLKRYLAAIRGDAEADRELDL